MIIEQSENFNEVIKKETFPLFTSNAKDIARYRLELDVYNELMAVGNFIPTNNDIQRIIDGLPTDVLIRELAART